MKIEDWKPIDFEKDPDIPKIVYKYRVWDNPYHQSIIKEQLVYLAPPTSFEDEKDCKLLERFDLLTDDEIYTKYLLDSKKYNPERSEDEHQEFAAHWSQISPLRDAKKTKELQEHLFQEYSKRFGVLSLSAVPDNIEMWAKYSDNGKGICVGFHSPLLFDCLGGGGEVQYYDKLPQIHPFDDDKLKHVKQVYSKERQWEFEIEYRTHKFWPNPATKEQRLIRVPVEAYAEIIFGYAIQKERVEEIVSQVGELGMNVKFTQALKAENSIILKDHENA